MGTTVGTVTAANSLVGSQGAVGGEQGDQVGSGYRVPITVLTNGKLRRGEPALE